MNHPSSPMFRRSFLALSAAAAGLAAVRGLGSDASAAEPQKAPPKAGDKAPGKAPAQAVILLWMNGGPSHLDTFDPKPGRPVMGPMRAIATSVAGVSVGEHLPRLAREAHRLSFVRSLTCKEGSHERARYLGHTGYSPNPTAAYPALGSHVSRALAAAGSDLPAYVSLSGPGGEAGMLGAAHAPFVVSKPGQAPDDTDPGVSPARFDRRTSALSAMDEAFAKRTKAPEVNERRAIYDRAFRLMRSPKLRAFDLEDEPQAVKAAYGDTDFGRGCLTARRLVESGVRFVEVTLDGWDTHDDNFARVKSRCEILDPAMSALVSDLATRSLLDKTIVVCLGEFGRTPRISGEEGRDHHPAAFSAVLAGGGLRAGVVVGQTDEDGQKVASDPVRVADLFATLATRLGMDPHAMLEAPNGRPVALTDGGLVVDKLVEN